MLNADRHRRARVDATGRRPRRLTAYEGHDIGLVGHLSAGDRRQWPARPFFTSAMATAITSTDSA
jgi:hypothetical protein